jgi:hypothetical protein
VSVILVIQPDAAQARVLNDMCRRIGAEMVDVESTKQAVSAIARRLPDLILLSAFLSPRDEDTLMSHLRSHEGASHLQTMTIPQFRTGDESKSKKSGFGFGKKKKAVVSVGADPAAFADEVVALLHRASEIRNRPAPLEPVRSVIAPEPVASVLIDDATESEPVFMNSLVDDTIFVESAETTESTGPALAEYAAESIEPAIADEPFIDEPVIEEPAVEEQVFEQPVFERPVMAASVASEGKRSRSITEEIDQLVRQLGLDVKLGSAEAAAPASHIEDVSANAQDDDFDLGASLERARNKAILRTDEVPLMHPDAEAIRESAMAEARAVAQREAREAREATAVEIARVQAEAQAVRVAAEARAAAEREAREALTAEHERKSHEAEQKAAAEREAREALAADLERKRQAAEEKAVAERQAREAAAVEFERKRQAAEQKAAAERQAREALAADLELKRQAAEAQAAAERQKREALAADLERARTEAEQKRLASIAEARAAAEREAREKLEADMARAQAEAEEKRHAAE